MLCENGKERWVNSVSQAKKKKRLLKEIKHNFLDMVVLFLLLFCLVEWIVKLIPFISRTCKLFLLSLYFDWFTVILNWSHIYVRNANWSLNIKQLIVCEYAFTVHAWCMQACLEYMYANYPCILQVQLLWSP